MQGRDCILEMDQLDFGHKVCEESVRIRLGTNQKTTQHNFGFQNNKSSTLWSKSQIRMFQALSPPVHTLLAPQFRQRICHKTSL
jgi:hypothetical protein